MQVAAMFHIASTKEPPPLPEHLPPEAKDFLLLCFNRVPKVRCLSLTVWMPFPPHNHAQPGASDPVIFAFLRHALLWQPPVLIIFMHLHSSSRRAKSKV
eukprot:1161575-Pelagomonas_calceolata.AAC.13